MPSFELANIDENNFPDSLTICWSVYIQSSWSNSVVLKIKNSDIDSSILNFRITKENALLKPGHYRHPGSDIYIKYYAKVFTSNFVLHLETSSISVWKYACYTANFVTGLLVFSNGRIHKNITVPELKNSKQNLTNNWNKSHILTMAETVSEVNVFTGNLNNIKCGDIGDIVSWGSPRWTFDNRIPGLARKKAFDQTDVCEEALPAVILTIPVKSTFMEAVNICKHLGNGNVKTYLTPDDLRKSFKKAIEDIGTTRKIWNPYKLINGSYVSFYNHEPIGKAMWEKGQPTGEDECVYCGATGCRSRNCLIRDIANFQCTFEKAPILILRGLCSQTNLDTLYYPSIRLGQFMWVGLGGTFVRYNNFSNVWIAKTPNKKIWATIQASENSLLLGTHEWTLYNDQNCFPSVVNKIRLNLSYCNNSLFNCGDGSCIDMDKRCNAITDCGDRTDEIGCNFVSLPEGYDKEVDYIEKDDLLIGADIKNFLEIDENLGKIKLVMRLHLEWEDPELNFINLKNSSDMNVLDDEEYSIIWKPKLIFCNMEKKDFEEILQPQINIWTDDIESFNFSNYESLYNSKIYNGDNIILWWFSEFR